MTKTIGVGIIGLGTVGGGTAKVLMENAAIITARTTAAIELRRVCVRNVAKAQDKLTAMGDGYSFTDGSEFTLWISDDQNKIPLYIESPIRVGSIQAYITAYKGCLLYTSRCV